MSACDIRFERTMEEMGPTAMGARGVVTVEDVIYERCNETFSQIRGDKGFSVADLVSVLINLQIGENQDGRHFNTWGRG